MTRLLLTGAAGFLGSHVLEEVLTGTSWDVLAADRASTRGWVRAEQAARVSPGRVTFLTCDLTGPCFLPEADYVIAMASDVSVTGSLEHPGEFIRDNTQIALTTLGYCRESRPAAVIWVSTGEVHGPSGPGMAHPEWSPVVPYSPYAAAKAAQEAVAVAYWRSYGVPVIIACTANLFGEWQDPGKLLPSAVRAARDGREFAVQDGTRRFLHARNLASALLFLLRTVTPVMFPAAPRPSRFNVTGGAQVSNRELAVMAAQAAGLPLRCARADPATARPGHEAHYALDGAALAAAGWEPPVTLEAGISRTVSWLMRNPGWLG